MRFFRLPEINLAPVKYANVHQDHGGPIQRLSRREVTIFGKTYFETYAYLNEGLGIPSDKKLYGTADGTGTAKSDADSAYAAISEALERWAWASLWKDRSGFDSYGYELDAGSTGFAAFPGLGKTAARRRAYYEAAERWSVAMWWEGKIGHRTLSLPADMTGTAGIALESPVRECSTVILWKKEYDFTAYGFAASNSEGKAVRKAQIELFRNLSVLNFFQKDPNQQLTTRNEIRLRYFAEKKGTEHFAARVQTSVPNAEEAPKLVVDRYVTGPWQQYTHVWRCLFENSKIRETDEENYFLF